MNARTVQALGVEKSLVAMYVGLGSQVTATVQLPEMLGPGKALQLMES